VKIADSRADDRTTVLSSSVFVTIAPVVLESLHYQSLATHLNRFIGGENYQWLMREPPFGSPRPLAGLPCLYRDAVHGLGTLGRALMDRYNGAVALARALYSCDGHHAVVSASNGGSC